jgi:hypothetical protein
MSRDQKRPAVVVRGSIPPGGRVPVGAMFRSGQAIGLRDLKRFVNKREKNEAIRLARETLSRPNVDPDCNACVMARQLLVALKMPTDG